MIKDIIDGITKRLRGLFGDGYAIYVRDVSQKLELPCFFVRSAGVSEEPMLGSLRRLRAQFCVTYMDGGPPGEAHDVEQKLYGGLCLVSTGLGLLAGVGMRSEWADGSLRFFVSYGAVVEHIIGEAENDEPMERLEHEVGF